MESYVYLYNRNIERRHRDGEHLSSANEKKNWTFFDKKYLLFSISSFLNRPGPLVLI